MPTRKLMLGIAMLFAGVPLAALAQNTDPTSTLPNDRPSLNAPGKFDLPLKQGGSMEKTTTTANTTDKRETAAHNKFDELIGLTVLSSDGSKLGAVRGLSVGSDGEVKAIHIKSGSFLGFGGKVVAIPEGKYTRLGDEIRLDLTADEVSKLPEFKGPT